MNELSSYSKNVTSQFGEDGIIEEIFKRIGTTNKICVEFGAWDGMYLSNTWNLWHNMGWDGVLIEGDSKKYNELVAKYSKNTNLKTIHAFVGTESDSLLDNILSSNDVPTNFDLLSIDIDGDEYYVFESLKKFTPRVVIIEHNPTIPPHLSILQARGEYFGASALALQELFTKKGYILVACTETNSIYVKYSDFFKLDISPPKLENIFPKNNLTYAISAYDGRTFLSQNPVYANKIEPVNIVQAIKDRIKLYTSNYEEKIKFSRNENLIPVRIYINYFFYKDSIRFYSTIKNKLISIIKTIPVLKNIYSNIEKKYIEYRIVSDWNSNGRPLPPPHVIKQRIIKKYCRSFNIKNLVETGTYLGDMIDATLKYFDSIYSIEIDRNLYESARTRFSSEKNVFIFLGDSSIVLKDLIGRINGRTIFWLDGHYSEGITGKGSFNTPIIDEINAISESNIKDHVILIDDARCFNGTGDYPLLDDFIKFLKKKMSCHRIFVENDVIQVIPA